MFASKRALLSILLISLFLMSTTAVVFAVDEYLPGVSNGQYAKYGNFLGTGPGMEAYNNNDWMKYEVTAINQTQVTLRLTGQFKNGTTMLGNGEYWTYSVLYYNVVNGTPTTYSVVIAKNLTKGDLVAPSTLNPNDIVNDTQTRTYLGSSRSVNVFEYTNSSENSNTKLTCIYDRESGMLMEVVGESTDTQTSATRQFSYSVTETNIFGLSVPVLGIPAIYFYVIVAAVAVAIVVVLVVVYKMKPRRRRRR
jgi:hypothetical protein